MPPYNILMITADDQRWDTLGNKHIAPSMNWAMPNVWQGLVQQGTLFTNGFISSPLCGPSRATSLTGQFAHNHGVIVNHGPNGWLEKFDDSATLATWMQSAGYTTAIFGKYGNDYEQVAPYVPPGWDKFSGLAPAAYENYDLCTNGAIQHYGTLASDPANYSTDVISARAQQFIDNAITNGTPWFAWVCPYAPHLPSTPAPRYVGAFDGVPLIKPPNFNQPGTGAPPWRANLPALNSTQLDLLKATVQNQLEASLATDDMVGDLLGLLTDRGVLNNTVIIYQGGDNGWQWGEHRLIKKEAPYEEAIRTSIVIRHPQFGAATRDGLVCNVDLASTVLDIAGGTATIPQNGTSLIPMLSGGPGHDAILIEHTQEGTPDRSDAPTLSGVRTADYKLIVYDDQQQGSELFDLGTDPYEMVNQTSNPVYATVKASLVIQLNALKAQ